MDFEKQIQTDRESLIQDIIKLVSIDSVEAAPEAGMPFGAGPAKALDCFLEMATMPVMLIMASRKRPSESSVMWM